MSLKSYLTTLCLVALTACGGGGGSPGDTTSPLPPTTPVQSGNKIFVGDNNNYKMAAIDTLTPKPGPLVAKVFTTDATVWLDAAFDAGRDELYVAASKQIDVYATASKLDGTIKASRSITATNVPFIQRVILDKANDRLYAGFRTEATHGVAVFEGVSKLSGNVTPSRIFTGSFDSGNFDLDLKRNLLYTCLSQDAQCEVYVFENIDKASGRIDIKRRFWLRASAGGVSMDSGRDRLYVADIFGYVRVVSDASTASGNSVNITSLKLPTANRGTATRIDASNDRLYVGFVSQAFVLDDVSKLSSSTVPAVAINADARSNIAYFALPQQ